ncbi:MAG: hypothetical protein IJL92_05090 [Thermoguttaceae bacterium]|nr:hypothetical protein [Thermoguttaceae bacterium]
MTTVYKAHNSYKSNGNSIYATVSFKDRYESPDSPYANIGCRAMQNMGKSIRPHWPVDCALVPDEKRRKPGDASVDSPFLFFSSRAYLELQDLIEPYGESYRVPLLNGVEENWVVYLPLRCLSVIDDPRCEIDWLGPRENNRPFGVKKFYFEEEKLEDNPIFTLEEDTAVFVTDKFFDRVRDAGLKGLGFRKLWNSEQGSIHSEITTIPRALPEDEDFNW